MGPSKSEGGLYRVHNSGQIAEDFYRLQLMATLLGLGDELLEAARQAYQRLRQDPDEFGEPLYRLPAMRLQVRHAAIRPLVIYFAVSEDRPDVYIKSVHLL